MEAGLPISVLYSGILPLSIGVHEDRLTVPAGTTVRQLLDLLASRHGEPFREAMFVVGDLVPNAIVIALGKEMRHGRGLDLPIEREGRVELILLPPASGGG